MVVAVLGAIAVWPQVPPAVDHSQHPLVEVARDLPVPSMKLHVVADSMDGVNIALETRNFQFTPGQVGTLPVPNEGHAHLYVNGEKVARLYAPWHHLPSTSLLPGVNRIEVEFSTNDHGVWSLAGNPIGADVLIDTRDREGDAILREEVSYTLDWNWGTARRHADGGWQVRTDLGYHVRVTGGTLVTRGLELVTCHAAMARAPQTGLVRWMGPLRVSAGHSSLEPGESRITASYEESLGDPVRRFLERLTVTDPEYCRAHYLLARARGIPPPGTAMAVSGLWGNSAESIDRPFLIRSSAAFGQFLDLVTEDQEVVGRRSIVGGIDVTVRRELHTLFDGIDFQSLSPEQDGNRMIRRLVGNTRVILGPSASG